MEQHSAGERDVLEISGWPGPLSDNCLFIGRPKAPNEISGTALAVSA